MPPTPHPRRPPRNADSDLRPLFEFSTVINASLDVSFVLNTLLLTVMGKLMVTKGIALTRTAPGVFTVVAAKGLGRSLIGTELRVKRPPRGFVSLGTSAKASSDVVSFFRQQGLDFVAPILSGGTPVGYLSVGGGVARRTLSHSDRHLLRSMLNLSAAALQRSMMVEELKNAQRIVDQKYQELNTLFELGKEFNRNLDTEVIVRLLTYSLMGQVGVNRYAICLCADGVPHVVTARLEGGENIGAAASRLGGLLNAALVSELARRKRYADAAMELEALGVQAVVPMVTQNTQKGLILLGPRIRGNAYTERDLQFVSSLGNLAIISIENVRLFKEALEKQRLEEDLKIAREIQQGLLPLDLPRVPGYELAAVNVSSRQVGGDYYDAVLLTDHQLALAIGDVSGKGTPAALLMSNVQAALRALAPLGQSIQETTGRINDLTCRNTGGDKFITLFWGILDTVTHVFTYVNAGHNYPFLLRGSGAIERLEEGGMILGIMATAVPYAEGTVVLRPGDVLFMFTDGVSEAMNSNGEDLTEEKLQEMLTSVRSLSASQIIREVTRGIEEHVGGAPQADDLTMLVLKRTA